MEGGGLRMVELPLKIPPKWGEKKMLRTNTNPGESREDPPHRNNPPEDVAKQGSFRESYQL